jgi:hypothetical protein
MKLLLIKQHLHPCHPSHPSLIKNLPLPPIKKVSFYILKFIDVVGMQAPKKLENGWIKSQPKAQNQDDDDSFLQSSKSEVVLT